MKYQIVDGLTIYDLMKAVQQQLDKGWDLQGGVSAVNTSIVRNNEIKYLQAMTYIKE